jgi:hypothetical protein
MAEKQVGSEMREVLGLERAIAWRLKHQLEVRVVLPWPGKDRLQPMDCGIEQLESIPERRATGPRKHVAPHQAFKVAVEPNQIL